MIITTAQMREGTGGKFDVHCFLFTDMLLVCKSLSRKGERVKVMIMTLLVSSPFYLFSFSPDYYYYPGDPPAVHSRPLGRGGS